MADLSEFVKGDIEYYNTIELYFDTLSIKKLVILSILTFGFYEIIWFYNTWKKLAVVFGHKVSPFWRAVFCGISGFWLFPILEKYIKKFNVEILAGSMLATLYFCSNLLYKLPDELWFLSYVSVVIIAIVQDKINKVNKQYFPDAEENCWSTTNTVWAVICGIWFVFALIGTLIPD